VLGLELRGVTCWISGFEASGFKGSWFRVWGLGFRSRVQPFQLSSHHQLKLLSRKFLGLRVEGLGFRV
jgi:hypothetical protein